MTRKRVYDIMTFSALWFLGRSCSLVCFSHVPIPHASGWAPPGLSSLRHLAHWLARDRDRRLVNIWLRIKISGRIKELELHEMWLVKGCIEYSTHLAIVGILRYWYRWAPVTRHPRLTCSGAVGQRAVARWGCALCAPFCSVLVSPSSCSLCSHLWALRWSKIGYNFLS